MITLDKKAIDLNQDFLNKKIDCFKYKLPSLNFDKHGRAKIGQIKEVNVEGRIWDEFTKNVCNKENYKENMKYFNEKLLEYCNENNYTQIKSYTYIDVDYLINSSHLYTFNLASSDINENYLHFLKSDGTKVKVKFTKVLSQIYKDFEKDYPKYKEIKEKLKAARESSENIKIAVYKQIKKTIEDGIPIFEYDRILNNQSYKNLDLYISVNPLDVLASSGNSAPSEENEVILTTFNTCYSTMIINNNSNITIKQSGSHGIPKELYLLNKVLTRAIIYSPNSRELQVPGTDFNLIGYQFRNNCWLNYNSLFLEKSYPTIGLRKDIEQCLSDFNIDVYDNEDTLDKFEESLQDTALNKEVLKSHVYLDNVGIDDDGYLYMLPEARSLGNYENSNGIYHDNDEDDEDESCYGCGSSRYETFYSDYYEEYYCDDCFKDRHYTCCSCLDTFVIADNQPQAVIIDGDKFCPECAEEFINSKEVEKQEENII